MIHYNNKVFVVLENTENGEVDSSTKFTYRQQGNIVTCTYSGGRIIWGHLLAIVQENGSLDMRYHQVNSKGELMTGICFSTPEILANNKIRLHEVWRWTCGDQLEGTSLLEEQ